jgi:hypothetical protein
VIALVQRAAQERGEAREGVVFADVHAVLAQVLEVARGRAQRAEAVEQHVHLHAGARALDEAAGELLAGAVGLEDVALQVDVVMCVPDGVEHRRVGARTILQQFDPVARNERLRDAAHERPARDLSQGLPVARRVRSIRDAWAGAPLQAFPSAFFPAATRAAEVAHRRGGCVRRQGSFPPASMRLPRPTAAPAPEAAGAGTVVADPWHPDSPGRRKRPQRYPK